MKKGFTIALLAVFSLAVVGTFALSAKENPDGTLTIDAPAEKFPVKKLKEGKKAKPAVTFNHKKHGADLGCLTCHHTQEEAKLKDGSEAAKSCFECHGPEAETVEGKMQPDSHKIFHDKKIGKCLKCHKTDEKAMAAGAPTKCKDCHKE